ncbi:AMP-binding protein [Rhodococcus koreensis]
MGSPLSYASGISERPLLGETVGRCFARVASQHGDREAIVDVVAERRLTYRELAESVDDVAAGLLAHGVKVGDRVGLLAPSCVEWVIVQLAVARIGAVLVPLNPAYRAHELTYVLNHAGVELLVATESFKTSDYASMINGLREEVALREVVYFEQESWTAICDDGRRYRVDSPEAVHRASLAVELDAPLCIQYTSGTTGFPKGAVLSQHSILNNGHSVVSLLGFDESDRLCLPVPMFHNFGMIMGNIGALSVGAAVVIPQRSFDPLATLEAVADERCTSIWGVPTMFIAQLAVDTFDSFDLTSLKTAIMAGSPCPAEVMKAAMRRMGISDVAICYGQTETTAISMQTRVTDSFEDKDFTVGRVHPHVEAKIVDPATGAIVERGTTGEFCTRGYSVMRGYWNDPERTAEAIDSDGWMHSGDLAVMNTDGYVSIVGRMKDMVIRGGENLYPREVEEFLFTHSAVLESQVIGVPDAKYGEELMAWIRLKPGASDVTAEDIRTYCKGNLAHFKIPRYIHFVDEFPMTANGKVRKIAMREAATAILESQ